MTEPRPGAGNRQDPPSGPNGRSDRHDQLEPSPGQGTLSRDNGGDLADLLRRSGDGDEAAFAALYDATASKVYGLVVRVTRSPEIAAEVLQEVYLMAWQQAARFDPGRGSVVAWLCTLAHRRAVDRIRQVARERDREQAYEHRRVEAPADETWQEVEQAMDTDEVRAGLEALTPLQREAVSLAYYQGCTYQEVAARLGIPVGTAKARIRDGLKNLRSALGGQP
ncbi:ECF RNA polymerase sigma factor SigK [Kocuria sp. U4B]